MIEPPVEPVYAGRGLSAEELATVSIDISRLRAFRTRTEAPTNAQTLTVIDSIIDVLRIMIRPPE